MREEYLTSMTRIGNGRSLFAVSIGDMILKRHVVYGYPVFS